MMTWGATQIAQGALTLILLWLCVGILRRTSWKSRRIVFWPTFAVVAIIVLLFLSRSFFFEFTLGRTVLGKLQDQIRKSTRLTDRIGLLTDVGNVATGAAVVLTSAALSVLLRRPEKDTERRLELLRQIMYCSACLLVAGVVQVNLQHRWFALYFDDDYNIQQIGQAASGFSLLVGAVFSVASAFLFLPAGLLLEKHLPSAENQVAAQRGDSRSGWIMEILAILAPVLAALPFGKLLDVFQ
jgi:multisubunit Na+/H+ antiporter MnhB subunit